MIMKFIRRFTYLLIFLAIFIAPIYGATRIFLPQWIVSQISSSLPKGVKLEIGEMYANNKLGILYKDITYKNNSLDLKMESITIEPKASFSEPVNILISNGNIKTAKSSFFLSDLNGKVRLKNFSNREISFLGSIKEIKEVEKSILENINFFIKGVTANERSLEANAAKVDYEFLGPEGLLKVKLNDLNFVINLSQSLETEASALNGTLDLSLIGKGNLNRVINADNLSLNFSLNTDGRWFLPMDFSAKNIRSTNGMIGKNLKLSSKGLWEKKNIECSIYDIIGNKTECGKMIDVVDIDLLLNSDDEIFSFLADGYCVTPNAGCVQIIDSEIKTKNTAQIFTRLIASGIIDPIMGGALMGTLLSTPYLKSEEFDHEAKIEVKGNKISLNNKPLI